MLYYQALRKIRKEKKVTFNDLAKCLNRARENISAWERGLRQPCDSDIRIIAQYLNIDVKEISDLSPISSKFAHTPTPTSQPYDIDVPFDTKGLPKDVIAHINTLNNICVKYRASYSGLKDELNKVKTLFQCMPFIIYTKDFALKYTYVNETFIALSKGYNNKGILGSLSSDIFAGKEYSQILELEQKVLRTKTQLTQIEIFIPGSYKKRLGLLTIIPILSQAEEVTEIACYIEDITDRRADEIQRRELETVINKVNLLVWIGNLDDKDKLHLKFLSCRGKEIFGMDSRKLLKGETRWLDSVHPDDMELVSEWAKIKSDYKKCTYRIINKGNIEWVLNETFRNNDTIYGVITNITEMKKLSYRFSHIIKTLNASTDAIRVAQVDGDKRKYIFTTHANKDLYELPLAVIKNNPDIWTEYIHPDDKDKLLIVDNENKEGQFQLKYRLLLPGNKIKYIEENVFKKVIDGILYIGTVKRDITQNMLHAINKEMMDNVLDNISDFIWYSEPYPKYKCLYMNNAVKNIYGLSKEEAFKDPYFWLNAIHPKDRERIRKLYLKGDNIIQTNTYVIIRPDGTQRTVRDYKFRREIYGRILDYGITRDVTDTI